MTNAPLFVLAAYVAGATPAAYWVGRFFYRKDLRILGSCNLGATNALRVLGWKAAVPVVAIDILKGFAPAWWFPHLDDQTAVWWTVVYGAAAIVGHVFSFWVRFRGGKGVATSVGVLAAVAPVVALAGVLAWVLALLVTRTVSVASMVAAVTVGVAGFAVPGTAVFAKVFFGFIALFVIWAHRSNIRRLRAGEEPRIDAKFGRDGAVE